MQNTALVGKMDRASNGCQQPGGRAGICAEGEPESLVDDDPDAHQILHLTERAAGTSRLL